MSSLVYLLVWSPPPHNPYISSSNQCLLFAAHAHTIATCFAVASILYHLFLVFLFNSLLGTLSFTLTLHIHLTILISARQSATIRWQSQQNANNSRDRVSRYNNKTDRFVVICPKWTASAHFALLACRDDVSTRSSCDKNNNQSPSGYRWQPVTVQERQPITTGTTDTVESTMNVTHRELMLRSFQVVNSCSRVHDRWKSVPFMSWARELVITTGELELIW